MRGEQLLWRQTEVQRAGGGHLQSVVVNRYANRAADNGIVTVAQGVCKRLARGQRWIQGLIDPFEAILLESSGDGQSVPQEALCAREKREGVAVELAIVQKLHPVGPTETGDSQQALRHLQLEAIRAAEQHRRRPNHHVIAQKSK